jgi:hypothetical protein
MRAFSRQSFRAQLALPGLVMFRASRGRQTVGLHLWLQRHDVAYGHLGVTNTDGYASFAAYGLYWSAIEWFSSRAAWLHLGGSAGVHRTDTDGLAFFKQGWATGTRTAYLCGRCFDQRQYEEILAVRRMRHGPFFPAYRAGDV